MKTALSRFRVVAFTEGLSYVVLLFIAMPLKYGADMPMAVRYVGWAHGVLFMLYIATMLHAWFERRWSLVFGVAAFAASLVPFATFYLEYKLRDSEPTASASD